MHLDVPVRLKVRQQGKAARVWRINGGFAASALLLCAAFLIHLPLLLGRVRFEQTDGTFHYRAVRQVMAAFAQGVWYPRWLPEQLGGLGDPSLMHYPPLFHMLSAAAGWVTGDAWTGMRVVLLLATWNAGLVGFAFLRSRQGLGAALSGALLIEANPLMMHLAVKAEAYPWVAAYPLMLGFFVLLADLPRRRWVAKRLALLVCGTALAHILTCFMLLLCALPAIAVAGWVEQRGWRAVGRQMGQVVIAGALGVAMAGFYVVPAMTTMRFVTPSGWRFTKVCSPEQSFAFPMFTHGLGMCWASYQILFPLVALVLGVGVIWLARCRGRATVVCLSGWLVALLFSSEAMYALWRHWALLRFVQFPTRFDAVAWAAVLLVFGMAAAESWRRKRRTVVALAALPVVCLMALEWDAMRHRVVERAGDLGSLVEYRPATLGPRYREYLAQGGLEGECRAKQAMCRVDERGTKRQMFLVVSTKEQVVRLPLAFYPAWQVYMNGRAERPSYDRMSGLMTAAVSAGRNEVEVCWRPLMEEMAGVEVALVGWVVMGLVLAREGARF